jgi:hypothetical protein
MKSKRGNFAQLIPGDELASSLGGLISDGCDFDNLLLFLGACVRRKEAEAFEKRNLDSVKRELGSIVRRVETLGGEIAALGATPVGFVQFFRHPVFGEKNARGEPKFSRNYLFREFPDSLTHFTTVVKELKHAIAERHSVRHNPPARRIAYLYLYCCAATGRHVTYREMADLLNAWFLEIGSQRVVSEASVRMALQRFKRARAPVASYETVESRMKEYVQSCPTGAPSFADWEPFRK